jgi:iron complex transport system permease protein
MSAIAASRHSGARLLAFGSVAFAGCFLIAAWLGAEILAPRDIVLIFAEPDRPGARIILDWRLPRVLTAFCVGACLAVGGVVFQGIFRNPLAEPYLLGSAAGAAVGATIGLLLPLALPTLVTLPALAFAGAWGATMIVIALARAGLVRDSQGLLLAGIAVAAVLSAVRGLLMMYLSDETMDLKVVLSWLLGGVQTPHWPEFWVLAILTLVGVAACAGLARGLDVLGLGDDVAANMGLDVDAFIQRAVLIAAAVTAVAVVSGGIVGFVGLMVPHVLRWWIGPAHGRLVVAAAAGGGCLVMVLDAFARAAAPPSEVPLGLLTALIGGPFFIIVLARESRS